MILRNALSTLFTTKWPSCSKLSPLALTPSPKTEPRDVRESNRPERLERILYEEAHSAEQIVGILRQADVALGKGQKVPEVCKHLGISEQTYYRWRTK